MIVKRDTQATPAECTTKICVVDGRPGDYAALLAELPAEVRLEFCTTGREALRAAATGPVDVWLVNTKLRDMSGIELCDLLKSRAKDTVVYLLTDQYQASEERAAWLHGAALFRPKPAQASWLERWTQRRAPASSPPLEVTRQELASEAVPGN